MLETKAQALERPYIAKAPLHVLNRKMYKGLSGQMYVKHLLL
jgi:hypothetical protein